MGDYTLELARTGARDQALVGGKGANLGELIRAGFPVPAGFVVTTTAYTDFVDAAGLVGHPPEELRDGIVAQSIPEHITARVLAAYRELGSPAVAVRSSGTAEDLAEASFAGQHDTYLSVRGETALLDALRNCWASLWTAHAVAYREQHGWDDRELALAVVVQEMVDAKWAGVLFTADPVSGRRDQVVIEAVPGLGEALVSGTATGLRHVAHKRTGKVAATDPALPSQLTAELVRLGAAVEAEFGRPQDIEWTYRDGRCSLVQARPLTALPDEPTEPRTRRRRLRRAERAGDTAGDHMPFPPFPMDNALLMRPTTQAIVSAIRYVGLTAAQPDDVLSEVADGVVQVVPPRITPTRRVLVGVTAALPKLTKLLRTRPDTWRAWSERGLLPFVREADAADLTTLSDDELLATVHELMRRIGRFMPTRFGALPAGMLAGSLTRRLLGVLVGSEHGDVVHADLMSEVPCVTTASNAELARLAAQVRADPELAAAYRTDPGAIADRLRGFPAGRALLTEIDDYLATYGFRETSIFTVGLPVLRETPDVVHGLLKGLAAAPAADAENGRSERAQQELRSMHGARARLLTPLALRLLAPARTAVGFREDSHYQLVMVLAVARRVLLELGGRLVQRGALDSADDVAYLEPEETRTLAPAEMRAIVERRRSARAAALPGYSIVAGGAAVAQHARGELHGSPASRGTVVGAARIVRDESEFSRLGRGEVLVCPYTNPTWTPLFALAAAVVVDTGGAGSHAAIVAREQGIPAVMGAVDATRHLRDGQLVRVDGHEGAVVPLDQPDHSRPATMGETPC